MSRDSLLDFYREIVNSEKSFGIDYKNLSKQLIERIDKAIEYIKNNTHKIEWGDIESQDEESIDINDDTTETEFIEQLLAILGDKE